MRIGFDMLAVQSPQHGARGIGRYSANLVSSLLSGEAANEYLLYVQDDLPLDRVPTHPGAQLRVLHKLSESAAARIDRVAQENPDALDALVILSPFEIWDGYSPPARPDNGLKLVSVVYDLIPFLFQNERVAHPILPRLYRALEQLKTYDALLSISECTRRDVRSLLRISPERVVNILSASDPSFFGPALDTSLTESDRQLLAGHGIRTPFVFNVGGLDDRKNHFRLIDAFALLPEHLRTSYQLVFTFKVDANWRRIIKDYAIQRGVGDAIVLTGEIDDSLLRILYQRCAAFIFPSLYEGFGLPILEAMHCGAAVIAGNNSSQIEVVGDAGLLAEAIDSNDIATKLATILDDRDLNATLRHRAIAQAKQFSWKRTGELAIATIREVVENAPRKPIIRVDRGHRRKPTIAFFSPLPPRKSGVSDYSSHLLEELRKTYQVDLFHDRGYVPEPALGSDNDTSCDVRLFERYALAKQYHAVVYQMGNSFYHNFMFPTMLQHPGLVTLHDFCLAGFHIHYGRATGAGLGLIRQELLSWYPEHRSEILESLNAWGDDTDAIQRGCARKGWWLNRVVLNASKVMVVHSPWCDSQVRKGSPEYADRVKVIPFGIHPRRLNSEQRMAIRDKFQLPREALIVASFGFVHPDKMCPEALDAFAAVARDDPGALFVFVGEEADGGTVRRHAETLGLSDRVRFLGRQPTEAFDALMNVTDVGINLRMPPTNGETSAALLNLLASGVATVVTDVATFSDFPSTIVRKVRWETEGQEGLRKAIHELAIDRNARQKLGAAAWYHVEQNHEWSRVADLYVEAIERCHEELAAKSCTSASRSSTHRSEWTKQTVRPTRGES